MEGSQSVMRYGLCETICRSCDCPIAIYADYVYFIDTNYKLPCSYYHVHCVPNDMIGLIKNFY